MKHRKSRALNHSIVQRVTALIESTPRPWQIPSYKAVVGVLNAEGYATSRGSPWTPHRLYRMLQRNGYSGLYGIKNRCGAAHSLKAEKGHFESP
ncbi:recombinase family protein [Marinimicrobium sp. ABcell2]|uniref:recombinase family protein n=1 Tax=Marinimicrobium sp. ABcell2 TaxID=3069751 RepID=UPI00359C64A4